jgi:sec-independent protein translocase protein TatA
MGLALEQISLIAFFGLGSPGVGEILVIAVVAVVLFGSRLPEVARSLGGSYQQFRKGLADIQASMKNELDLDVKSPDRISDYSDVNDDYDEPSAPKFEPPEE